jgi:isoquinoline 1-oxidoreductase subunit alpha
MISVTVNGTPTKIDADPRIPLLWALRDVLNMTGTKYGCGIAACGACTVHIDGVATRSCQTAIGDVGAGKVTTIEGIDSAAAKAIQAAWAELEVPQCGYCQSGQIMSAVALLTENKNPSDADIDSAMSGNICRCAAYVRIKQGIQLAAKTMGA